MSKSYFNGDAGIALDGLPWHLLQDGRVLLTGGSGVVGIHMAAAFRRLIDEGSKLRLCVTNDFYLWMIEHLRDNSIDRILKCDTQAQLGTFVDQAAECCSHMNTHHA